MSGKTNIVPFEDALDLTGFGRYNYVMGLLCGSIIMAMAFETASVAYLVPGSACELQTTNTQQGLMAGIPLFGILVASNIWGYLADTRGRKKILTWSVVLGFITGSTATLSPNWIVFCFLKFSSACSMAGTYGLTITLLSECTPEARRFTFLVLISTVFLSCVAFMAVISIPILPLTFSYYIPFLDIHFNSWRLLNLIFSSPCAISAVGLLMSYESPRYLLSAGDEEGCLDVLRKIFILNTGRSEDDYKVKAVTLDEETASSVPTGFWSSVVSQTVPLLKPPLFKSTLLLSVLFISVFFCVHPYTIWLPYMIDGFMRSLQKGEVGLTFCQMLRSSQNDTHVEVTDSCSLNATAMTTLFGIELTVAGMNIVISFILTYVERKYIFIALQFLAGISALIMNFSTLWILTSALMFCFICVALNFGLLSTFSVDMFPTYVKAMGVCLTLMMGRGSAVLGVNLLKNLLANNCEMSFYCFGGICVFGGVVGFLLPVGSKRSRKRKVDVETLDNKANDTIDTVM